MIIAKKRGFTLIELMVVIVIIGILVAIALPNFIGAQDRAKIASLKSNMRTFQTMLEVYGVDYGGMYPYAMEELSAEAVSKNYAKSYKNPFTVVNLLVSNTTVGSSLAEVITGASVPTSWTETGVATINGNPGTTCMGQVIYRRPLPSQAYTKYTLYGIGKSGEFVTYEGSIFSISNN